MTSDKKSVYISYSWKKEKRKKTVEKIMAAFSAVGVEVKRDEKEIGYGDPIRAYMDELAAGGAIILVLSEPYIKSPNCMYELLEIYNHDRKKFRERIFPVVLKGTRFHEATDRLPYIRFWEEETKKLNSSFNDVSRANIGISSHQELRKYVEVTNKIDDLLFLIGDMNHLKEEDHLKDNFSALIKRIFPVFPPSGGDGTDKADQGANISQHIIGNGNISSLSGNVTVNNININTAETAPQPKKEDSPDVGFKLKIAYNIPNLPPNYLPRPEYIDKFRAALQKESIGLTGAAHLGVEGMGGIGKSVLAAALAHDEALQAAFPDGIFWLTFGQKVENDVLLVQQNNILNLLGHKNQEDSLDLSRHKLNSVLQGKLCLFIIDDIWDSKHLKCFDLSGTACRFLLTSRKADVLDRLDMERKRIDLLSEEQALTMLAQYARCALADLPKEAAEIVKECGYLPLAVAAIGSMVKGKPADRWQLALCKLQEAKLDKIACKFDYQYENLFWALQVSVEALPEAQQQYYKTLAVVPEDANIQESAIVLYWEHCAFSDDMPQDVIDALVDASLLTRVDDKTLRLHDLLRDYLISQTEDVAALHRQLLEAYKAKYAGRWHTIPYIYIEKIHHFTQKGYTYFCIAWYYHTREANDPVYAAKIADDLIRNQPLLEMACLKLALEFVDYKLHDIAPKLLEINKDIFVLKECLELLGNSAKKDDVLLVLKETINTGDVLNNENKKVIILCLEILGNEASEEIKRLLEKNIDADIIYRCLKILGEDGKEYTWRFLRGTKNFGFIHKYLFLLGEEAKEYAENLLNDTDDELIKWTCINFLGKDAKDDALYLIKNSRDEFIQRKCQNLIDSWEKTNIAE